MRPDLDKLTLELTEWFDSVSGLVQKSLFDIAPEGPHRDAVAVDSMVRNARILHNAEFDIEGKLYTPLCFFLVAACRYLRVHLGKGHWQAALENLCLAERVPDLAFFGLPSDSSAIRFKAELSAALEQAGLLDRTSLLNKDDRKVAVGLAVNWAMRLLLANAASFPNPRESSGRHDLAWLAARTQAALATCP